MAESEKGGFLGILKDALSYLSNLISASIFPPIAEGAEMVMKTIEGRIMIIEKRIVGNLSSLLIIGFGGVFLVFALLFYLRESLGWSAAASFFSIGIVVFVAGLLLKLGKLGRNGS